MNATREQVREVLDDAQASAAAAIKQRFVADYRTLAKQHGFDLTQGDVVLVHEADVPLAVMLVRGHDPVWINSRLVEPGKCLFVSRNAKHAPLYHGLDG